MIYKKVNIIKDSTVLVLPLAALGDLTMYLRLAWLFVSAGAKVTIVSNIIYTARSCFPWVNIIKEEESLDYKEVSGKYDLIVSNYERYFQESALNYENIAFVTAKKLPKKISIMDKAVKIKGMVYKNATRPFCLDSSLSLTMVQWVDSYAFEVYGINAVKQPLPVFGREVLKKNKVLIFPTTPQDKKNYWLYGFKVIASKLERKGWDVQFVCMPAEKSELQKKIKNYSVVSYPTIELLLRSIYSSSVVVSNDSGGGHLASLCGIKTFTFTRRDKEFTWRPGFTGENYVISPVISFKFFGNYIWRPFIPYFKVYKKINRYK